MPENYVCQPDPQHFDDRTFTDEWQNEVYAQARALADANACAKIVDYGCGAGFKFMKYFSEHETIGYEIEPSLGFLKEKYPDRQWRNGLPLSPEMFDSNLVISSDVIEHLLDPVALLNCIAEAKPGFLVISTPALELMSDRGYSPRNGPPTNLSHVNEWTTLNFASFISQFFEIVTHMVTNVAQCTQMIIAKPR